MVRKISYFVNLIIWSSKATITSRHASACLSPECVNPEKPNTGKTKEHSRNQGGLGAR